MLTVNRGASARFELADPEVPEWVQSLRTDATERFGARGYPTVREEDWKYTDVTPIARGSFEPERGEREVSDEAAQARIASLGVEGPRLVFVNGRFAESLSNTTDLPPGVHALSLARGGWEIAKQKLGTVASGAANPFVALNTGFLSDGVVLLISRGQSLLTPIQLLLLGAGSAIASHPRVLIALEERSEAAVVETYASLDEAPRFTNPVTEVLLSEGAILAHSRILVEGEQALHVGAVYAALGRSSVFRSLHITSASRLARTDLNVEFVGEGAECRLNGLYIASAGQHVDNHTLIDHAVPQCTSRQLYKGVIGDQATGVFNGKVIVRLGAQKTDANQTNKNLLLSERATVDTKPQLEILNDDVRCTHGAAVGPPDRETLFYLESRGLNPEEAIRLLAYGFGADVLSDWPLRSSLEPLVAERIEAAVVSGRR